MPTYTQRAYTLRLSGTPANCEDAHHHLWRTHEAVNYGVRTFADWLLTLRGGIAHELVDDPVIVRDDTRPPTASEQRDRRLLLALSWLTVESGERVPRQYVIDRKIDGAWATVEALRAILRKRGAPDNQIEAWVADCQVSLNAAIAEGAVWVNRSLAFDDAVTRIGPSLTRREVWDILGELLGKPAVYLALPRMDGAEDDAGQPKPSTTKKELRQPARQWLSSRYGSKQGADFRRIVGVYEVIGRFARTIAKPVPIAKFTNALCSRLNGFSPPPQDLAGIRSLLRRRGPTAGVIRMLSVVEKEEELSVENAGRLLRAIEKDVVASRSKIGRKGRKPWSNAILDDVEAACGFRYRDEKDRVDEFSLMLVQAARRVSSLHSWVKLAEQRRRELEADAQRWVPNVAAMWLREYCDDRTRLSGGLEPHRIRRRAIEGWTEVLAVWAMSGCTTEQGRIEAARRLQGDADLRFGDIQLFETLACEEGRCVWEGGNASILQNYVAREEARARQARYKVPAYCHPDPLRHPVFCDFGKSYWKIRFAAQQQPPAEDLRSLEMGLFTGTSIALMELRWHSKRLPQDLALNQDKDGKGEPVKVTRANRLGRAAGEAGPADAVQILGLFEEKNWNGRLQAPRRQLEEIADLCANRKLTEDERARRLARAKAEIQWTLTFSARLQPIGAWLKYAEERQLRPGWPHAEENKKRKGRAQLVLCRLPELRVLSVDLGHRYAATCAVWQVVNADEVVAACAAAGLTLADDALHAMVKQGNRTTLYRRTGASAWARLERSFVIRLPGEQQPDIRKAGPAETAAVVEMEQGIGHVEQDRRPAQVAELMKHSLTLLRRALARHNRRAGISIGLAGHDRVLPGGRVQALTAEEQPQSIAETLLDWYALVTDTRWVDVHAKELWEAHIAPLLSVALPADMQGGSFTKRKQIRADVLASLLSVAQSLSMEQRMELSEQWRTVWLCEETHLRKRLRWVKDWLLPGGHQGKSAEIRHTGGLSVLRLENLGALYSLQKAYGGRPRVDPEGHRAPPSTINETFAQQTLDALEHLREDRVKQIANRIVAASLGLGKDLTQQYLPCHAVVIENLAGYRPDETQTRRENRQLMSWCARRIGKYLGESCDLYGLVFREVPAAYTSRQDSVTGAPGVRVVDVPVAEFFRPGGFWDRQSRVAERAVKPGSELASRLLVELSQIPEEARRQLGCLRIPKEGGPIFVSADRNSPAAKGIQADLNAAANIGLRALMDPDWVGSLWYIPCEPQTLKPLMEKLKGSKAIDGEQPLPSHQTQELSIRDKPVNLWRDVSAQPLTVGWWSTYSVYRVEVLGRVCAILREQLSRRVPAAWCDLPF